MNEQISIAEIVDRIIPIEINSLKHYEDPSRIDISKIAYSLRSTGYLWNPVVVDADLGILIDGHHRSEAFRWLGFSKIPAFNVSYLSSAVKVGKWYYTIDAPDAEIEAAFEAFAVKDSGSFGVVAMNSTGQEIAVSYHKNPMEAARHLEHVNLFLSAAGYSIRAIPDTNRAEFDGELAVSYLSEPIGKDNVMEAISHGLLYPQQINRHLIDDRPLNLNFPLHMASEANEFRRFCTRSLIERQPRLVPGPSIVGGRLYEERTLQF